MHTETHPLAGKTVKLKLASHPTDIQTGDEFRIEDWWDHLAGGSWMFADGNPAALKYAMRSATCLPVDDEVVYGKVGAFGHLIHVSELGEEV
jgi:hypothetical protein